MDRPAPKLLVMLLEAPSPAGALVASYLRIRFPEMSWRFEPTLLDGRLGEGSAVMVEPRRPSAPQTQRLISRLRAERPEFAVLVASARPCDLTAAAALRCGAQGFLPCLSPISALSEAIRAIQARGSCFPRLVPDASRVRPPAAPFARRARRRRRS